MKQIYRVLPSIAMSLLLCAACNTPATSSPDTSSSEQTAQGSQGLQYSYNQQTQSYAVSGIGTCTDKEIVIPATYNNLPVTAIAEGAFKQEKTVTPVRMARPLSADTLYDENIHGEYDFEAVSIPDSIEEIGSEAFMGCEDLEEITMSSLVNMIGTDAFKDTAFYNDPANWDNGVLYLENHLIEAIDTFSGALNIREGITHITDGALTDCVGLTAVNFPASIVYIGELAFKGCTSITEVNLAYPGIYVGRAAFMNCTALTSIDIADDSVASTLPEEDLQKLEKFGNTLPENEDMVVVSPSISFTSNFFTFDKENFVYSSIIEDSAFSGCSALTDISVGKNLKYIGDFAFYECTALTNVSLTNMTVAIHSKDPAVQRGKMKLGAPTLSGVFACCTSLESVVLPEGLTSLTATFQDCTALKTITLPSTVKKLNRTFNWCAALESVNLPTGLERIGYDTFKGCTALQSITLPDSVTVIRAGALAGLPQTCTITLGKGIIEIGEGVFEGDITLYYLGTAAEWNAIALHENWVLYNENAPIIHCADMVIGG